MGRPSDFKHYSVKRLTSLEDKRSVGGWLHRSERASQGAHYSGQENKAPSGGSSRLRAEVRAAFTAGKAGEPPWDRSRNRSEGSRPGSCTHRPGNSREGGAVPNLRGASVFTTEPSPRGRHHPAETLLLLHEVAASALRSQSGRVRGRRGGLHKPRSFRLVGVPHPVPSRQQPLVPCP